MFDILLCQISVKCILQNVSWKCIMQREAFSERCSDNECSLKKMENLQKISMNYMGKIYLQIFFKDFTF